MANNSRLTNVAVKIGATAGRISGRASKARRVAAVATKELLHLKRTARKEAAQELRQVSKMLERMRRDLGKANKRVRRAFA